MGENLTRSQKFGIQWRWLFLIGGVIYAFNTIKVIFKPQEVYNFLGMELNIWIYILIHSSISIWLLITFVKNRRLFKKILLERFQNDLSDDDKQIN
jgi:hypothetical protein